MRLNCLFFLHGNHLGALASSLAASIVHLDDGDDGDENEEGEEEATTT